MWILEVFSRNGFVRQVLLVAGMFSIGRKDCDLLLPEGDPSLSRRHAVVTALTVAAGNMTDVAHTPSLLLADESKHGTSVNGERILSTADKVKLEHGDVVVLGRDAARIHVHYVPIVAILSGTLSSEEIKEQQFLISKLGGSCFTNEVPDIDVLREQKISPVITAFVTNRVSNENTALLALMNRYVLVSTEYFKALHELVRNDPSTTIATLPRPFNYEAERDPLLADVAYFRPEPAIFGVQEFLSAEVRPAVQLFRQVHCLCINETLMQRYLHVLNFGGGAASLVSADDVLVWGEDRQDYLRKSKSRGNSPSRMTTGSVPRSGRTGDQAASLETSGSFGRMQSSFVGDEFQTQTGEQQQRYLPLYSLPGVDRRHFHGLNTWVLVSAEEFQHLLRHLAATFGETSYKHTLMADLTRIRQSPPGTAEPPPFQGQDLVVVAKRMDAYVAMWNCGYNLVHEDNILLAAYCGEATPHLQNNGPGILCKAEMAVTRGPDDRGGDMDDSDADSEATVEHLGEAVMAIAEARATGTTVMRNGRRQRRQAEREIRITEAFRRSMAGSPPRGSSPPRSAGKNTRTPQKKASDVVLCRPEQLGPDPLAVAKLQDAKKASSSSSATKTGTSATNFAQTPEGVVYSRQASAFTREATSFSAVSAATTAVGSTSVTQVRPGARDLYSEWRHEIGKPAPFAHVDAHLVRVNKNMSSTAAGARASSPQHAPALYHPEDATTAPGTTADAPYASPPRTLTGRRSDAADRAVIAMCESFSAPLLVIEHQVQELGRTAAAVGMRYDTERPLRLARDRVSNFSAALLLALRDPSLSKESGSLKADTAAVVDQLQHRIHNVQFSIDRLLELPSQQQQSSPSRHPASPASVAQTPASPSRRTPARGSTAAATGTPSPDRPRR